MNRLQTRNKKRHVIWGLTVLLLMIIVGVSLTRGHRSGDISAAPEAKPIAVDVAQAVIKTMDTIVTAQGTLVAPQGASARVAAVNAGRLVDVRVREGDRVNAGQIIAIVDSRVQQEQARSAAAALRVSQLQAEQSDLAAQAAATDQANSVKAAQLELEAAGTELHKVGNGARPQEIAQAQQAVNEAQANRDRAATELERVSFLHDKGIAAGRQLDDAKTALSVADSTLESARQQLDLLRAGARPEDLHAAQLRVDIARANLKQAEQGSLQVSAKQREAQASLESVQQKSADLAAAQVAAGYSQICAPLSGVVIRRFLNPGDLADTSTPIVEITDSHTVDLSANLPAEDGARLQTNMPARVMLASVPGRTFSGRVLSVGQVDPQSGLLTVRITIPNPDGTLHIGGFATVDVIVATNPQAVAVPKEAIIDRDGKTVVFTVGPDRKAHQQDVQTGVEQGGMLEIVGGIAPGDRVILLGQYELTDGMDVRMSNGSPSSADNNR